MQWIFLCLKRSCEYGAKYIRPICFYITVRDYYVPPRVTVFYVIAIVVKIKNMICIMGA